MTIYIFYPFFILALGSSMYFLANKIFLIDKPNDRKMHKGNIPLIGGITGGIAIYIFSIFLINDETLNFIILTAIIILILGIIDDIFDLHFSYRIVFQLFLILIVIDYGILIVELGDFTYLQNIELGFFGIVLTFLCISGLTNSLNFIDGSDGLCAITVLISFINIVIFSLLFKTNIDWDFFYLIIVYLLIFLYFNVFSKKYKIFLGDSGSTFFGFILSLSLIYFTSDEMSYFNPILVIWCVALPIYDLFSVIIKRIINKKNPFLPDRTHIHHILKNKNYSSKKIFSLIILIQFLLSFIGLMTFVIIGPEFTLLNFILVFLIYLIISFKIEESNSI